MATKVQEAVIRRLRAAGGIEVRPGGPADLVLSVRGGETPITLDVRHRFTESAVHQIEGLTTDRRGRTVLVVPELSRKWRRELRFRDISWIEYRSGFVHVRVPHLAVDLPESPRATPDEPSSVPSLSGKAGIVVEALIQLGCEEELVSQPDVAELSGSTQAWTSRVFGALVEAGALEVVGRGPSKEWRPNLDALLRLWVEDGGPVPDTTGMYIWSRTPDDLLRSLTRIGETEAPYAVGGVAAANLHEPTLTTVPLVNLWLPHSHLPAELAIHLDGELVDAGANVVLWQASGDPALRLAARLDTWREDAPAGLSGLPVVTPARAAVESLAGTGRAPEVGEKLRERILNDAERPS